MPETGWDMIKSWIEDGYRSLIETVDGLTDRRAAFDLATQGIELLRTLNADLGRRRAKIADDVRVADALTLAELGDWCELSETRARQLIKKARDDRG